MRLLSYNIHKGIGGADRRYRIERIIDVIESENPDIICLQEVDRSVRRSRYDDQPKILAEYFHAKEYVFQLNVHLKAGGYGNLVLSRWPILTTHRISLRFNNKKPRGAQCVVLETPEGSLHVVNWHLGLSKKERQWQVNHLLQHHCFNESTHLPTIIAGDFNDWFNTLAGGPFTQRGFIQVTSPPSRFRTFPAYLPAGSLDKAFYKGSILLKHAKIVKTSLAKRASDHLPLVVDFHLQDLNRDITFNQTSFT